jgi:hypothetical protein
MIELTGQKLPTLPVLGLKKVRDLEYFDGPLLSHFAHEHGDHYLYYWCDSDERVNRWMMLRVNETNIIRLVNRYLPLDQVIPGACQDDFVYFLDLDAQGKVIAVFLTPGNQVPEEYTPEPGAYLDRDLIEEERSYPVLIEGPLSLDQLGGIATRYSQAYVLFYALQVLKPESFADVPPSGRFAPMHFYRQLFAMLPGEARPAVLSLQYTPPGFVRFRLHRPTAEALASRLANFSDPHSTANSLFLRLRSYVIENRLGELGTESPGPSGAEWEQWNPELSRRTKELLAAIQVEDADTLIHAVRAPIAAAKIGLWLAVRLRDLARFVNEGLIRFPAR